MIFWNFSKIVFHKQLFFNIRRKLWNVQVKTCTQTEYDCQSKDFWKFGKNEYCILDAVFYCSTCHLSGWFKQSLILLLSLIKLLYKFLRLYFRNRNKFSQILSNLFKSAGNSSIRLATLIITYRVLFKKLMRADRGGGRVQFPVR